MKETIQISVSRANFEKLQKADTGDHVRIVTTGKKNSAGMNPCICFDKGTASKELTIKNEKLAHECESLQRHLAEEVAQVDANFHKARKWSVVAVAAIIVAIVELIIIL